MHHPLTKEKTNMGRLADEIRDTKILLRDTFMEPVEMAYNHRHLARLKSSYRHWHIAYCWVRATLARRPFEIEKVERGALRPVKEDVVKNHVIRMLADIARAYSDDRVPSTAQKVWEQFENAGPPWGKVTAAVLTPDNPKTEPMIMGFTGPPAPAGDLNFKIPTDGIIHILPYDISDIDADAPLPLHWVKGTEPHLAPCKGVCPICEELECRETSGADYARKPDFGDGITTNIANKYSDTPLGKVCAMLDKEGFNGMGFWEDNTPDYMPVGFDTDDDDFDICPFHNDGDFEDCICDENFSGDCEYDPIDFDDCPHFNKRMANTTPQMEDLDTQEENYEKPEVPDGCHKCDECPRGCFDERGQNQCDLEAEEAQCPHFKHNTDAGLLRRCNFGGICDADPRKPEACEHFNIAHETPGTLTPIDTRETIHLELDLGTGILTDPNEENQWAGWSGFDI